MSIIKVTATTVSNFNAPAGTPVGGFMRYKLVSSTGIALGLQDVPVTAEPFVASEVDWPDQPVGHYTMTAQRYDGSTPVPQAVGAEYDQAVVIAPPPPVVMSVPSGMTITVS